MSQKLNVMMVGAHPADAFDAVGGTLAKHADAGDHVEDMIGDAIGRDDDRDPLVRISPFGWARPKCGQITGFAVQHRGLG